MKTRIEYADNRMGLKLALANVAQNGGRAVTVGIKNYWYSYQYTPSEIFSDFIGKTVEIH